MKNKDRGINRKKQRAAAKKEALRGKDAAFFAAVKYTLLAVGLMFLSCILYYIGYEYSPNVFLLSTRETPVCFLLCIMVWLSDRCIKKVHDNIQPSNVVFRYFSKVWYIAIFILALLTSLLWVLDLLLSL